MKGKKWAIACGEGDIIFKLIFCLQWVAWTFQLFSFPEYQYVSFLFMCSMNVALSQTYYILAQANL